MFVFALVLQAASGFPEYLKKAEQAVAEERYDEAFRHLKQAELAAIVEKDVDAVAKVKAQVARYTVYRKEYGHVKEAHEKLLADENDPEANLAYGRFLAFVKGEFIKAIPYFARGSDPFLKVLSERELSSPSSPMEKLAIGHSWWEGSVKLNLKGILTGATATVSQTLKDEITRRARPLLQGRAVDWYRYAWNDLPKEEKDKLRTRLRGYAKILPIVQSPGLPPEWIESTGRQVPKGAGLVKGVAYEGNACLKLVPGADLALHGLPGQPGKKYAVSAWVWSEGNVDDIDVVRLWTMTRSGAVLGQGNVRIPPDFPFWTRVEFTYDSQEMTGMLRVNTAMPSTGGVIFVDCISVTLDGKDVMKNGSFEGR